MHPARIHLFLVCLDLRIIYLFVKNRQRKARYPERISSKIRLFIVHFDDF